MHYSLEVLVWHQVTWHSPFRDNLELLPQLVQTKLDDEQLQCPHLHIHCQNWQVMPPQKFGSLENSCLAREANDDVKSCANGTSGEGGVVSCVDSGGGVKQAVEGSVVTAENTGGVTN
nr:hypothetical protein L195_g055484 [Ipomoea trifida]